MLRLWWMGEGSWRAKSGEVALMDGRRVWGKEGVGEDSPLLLVQSGRHKSHTGKRGF